MRITEKVTGVPLWGDYSEGYRVYSLHSHYPVVLRLLLVRMQGFSLIGRRLIPGVLLGLLLLAGCGHLRLRPHAMHEYVYVWARGTYLRDRVAAVSNRVAEVVNGQRLQVLEHGRRFLKVKTDKGEVGWIEEHSVISQQVYDEFTRLSEENAHGPVVATAVLRDDYWLRDGPGRKSNRFLLLPENTRLQLLMRASVPKPEPPQALLPVVAKTAKNKADTPAAPPPPNLEDYWLVRDSAGHVGWVRGRTLDEDVPDAVAGLAEGQKIVGAYVLKTVNDPESSVPGGKVPEYVTLLSPWKDGLPYDFDQVRVFTWNTKKHRYETAYRERNIAGYLPITVSQQTFGNQQEPVFSFRVATGDAMAIDTQTGMVRPGATTTESYHMEGVIVRRIGDQPPPPPTSSANNHQEERHRHHRRRRG